MKILRTIARLNVGGPARHVVLLNESLQRRGHTTVLIHGAVDSSEASAEHLADGSGIRRIKLKHLNRRIHLTTDLTALVQIVALLFREQPDVVHTHTAKAGTIGRLAAVVFNVFRRSGRRAAIIHTFHGHVFEGYFPPIVSFMVRLMEWMLAATSDRIVTISDRQYHDIVTRFRISSPSQTRIIPLGLDLTPLLGLAPSRSDERWRQLNIGVDELVVGCIGRMVPVKDLETLIRGFAIALSSRPNLRLVLAGDGPTRPAIEQVCRDLRLETRVHLVGWIHDLTQFFGLIDICALSSINEGTPVGLIEAMAAAKPIVATAVGGVPDIVQDGVNGLLVPPSSPEALGAALVHLAVDEQRRRAMGEKGRMIAAARFSRDRLTDDIERLYVEALAEKRGVIPRKPDPA